MKMPKNMKIATIIIALLTLISPNSYCQESFFIKQKSYECTEGIGLNSSFSHFSGVGGITLRFANERDQAMIILSIKPGPFDNLNEERIREDVFLYLDDNSVISCHDKNLFDLLGPWAHTVYYLSKKDTEKIKKSNIKEIRYKLGSNTHSKYFTANNHDRYEIDLVEQEKRNKEREERNEQYKKDMDRYREALKNHREGPKPLKPWSHTVNLSSYSPPKKNVGPMDFSKILNVFLY